MADASGPEDHHDILADSTHFPPPQRESSFGDSSGPLFSLYSKIAEGDDNMMTERWQKDAEGLLIFVSACHGVDNHALMTMNRNTIDWFVLCCVAALLAVSVQDIRPNPQDTSAFYLAEIYQIFADPNGTAPGTSFPSTVAIPPPFSHFGS